MANRITDPQVSRSGNVVKVRELKSPWRVADIVSAIYRGRKYDKITHFVLQLPSDISGFPNVITPLATVIQLYRELGLKIDIESESQFFGLRDLQSPLEASAEVLQSRDVFSHIW